MKKKRYLKVKVIAAVLLFAMILRVAIDQYTTTSDAAAVQVGTVAVAAGSNLMVRSIPDGSGAVLARMPSGATVTILGEENGWYRVQYNGVEGYSSAEFITDIRTVEMDDNYTNVLMSQGFPQSYAVRLSELHARYPNWVFEPVITGLDWNTVVAEEGKKQRCLVENSVNDARKSTDSYYYDWSSNTWYIYDSGRWVGASPEFIAYCMDPRNWLDETYIFQFESLAFSAAQTVSGVSSILAGSFMAGAYTDATGTFGYADIFYQVGSELGVSPYHLASRCLQEQGAAGGSQLISGASGYYNYFNIGASGGTAAAVVQNGLAYAQKAGWNSVYKSIQGGAGIIASNYIQKGQNTKYFEKFNVVYAGNLFNHQYMQNVEAAKNEGAKAGKAYSDKSQAFVFRIPVYANMPENPAGFTDSGNPNNWLSSLSVSVGSITPGFSGANTSYSIVVDETVNSITVNAAPVARTSSVSGTGTYSLQYGNNAIQIVCTAQNGNARIYEIVVARQGGGAAPAGRGDVNRDGRISNADIVLIKRHILSVATLSGDAAAAADVNQDGRISNADIVLIKRHILGLETIQ